MEIFKILNYTLRKGIDSLLISGEAADIDTIIYNFTYRYLEGMFEDQY